jgi:hypothetical protein
MPKLQIHQYDPSGVVVHESEVHITNAANELMIQGMKQAMEKSMTETELRIADLELRIGDIELVIALDNSGRVKLLYSQILDLEDQKSRLTEELQCLKQSLPQQQSE